MPRIPLSLLDFKLGLRMLVRYPALTIIGGLAMAFAIWVGAGAFEIVSQIVAPSVPLPQGDQIVGLRLHDAKANEQEPRIVHDFAAWREELRAVEDVGAFRSASRNLVVAGDVGEPVDVAEISAAAFRVTRVPPLLGRPLVDGDEAAAAPGVVVIGYDVWQARFGGDPAAIGRSVRVGAAEATVVGVMPQGYAFPVAHGAWVPLRVDPLQHERRAGPALQVFGRLADGATLESARAEVAALGRRMATSYPETHEHLRPDVVAYPRLILDVPRAESVVLASSNVFLLMLLVLICGNVALLLFARAATRRSELVVRSALGASRGRIIAQLFAEALVLGALAAALGLGAAGAGMRWAFAVAEAQAGVRLPFWFSPSLSPATIGYALFLTFVAAAVAGVTPALKVTRGLQSQLREAAAQGGGIRFGGVWTAVIVTQVALTVAFPVSSFMLWRDMREVSEMMVPFETEHFLTAQLDIDPEQAATTSLAQLYQELAARLEAEPAVEAVSFAERLPRMYHPHRLVELDAGEAAPLHPEWPAYRISAAGIDARYLDVVGVRPIAGRGFTLADAETSSDVILVNESFVRRVLGGRNAIGRRVRYSHHEASQGEVSDEATSGRWYEIVGVVPDMGMSASAHDPKSAGIYHPVTPDALAVLNLAIRVRGEPAAFTPRLARIAADVDPALRLRNPLPMDALDDGELTFYQFWLRLSLGISAIALILSLSSVYAVMAFTVARRTREIGIRIALGANARRLIAGTLRRPLVQVTAGLLAGAVLAGALLLVADSAGPSVLGGLLLVGYAGIMMGVCALACIVPVRRALGIEPTEALRADG